MREYQTKAKSLKKRFPTESAIRKVCKCTKTVGAHLHTVLFNLVELLYSLYSIYLFYMLELLCSWGVSSCEKDGLKETKRAQLVCTVRTRGAEQQFLRLTVALALHNSHMHRTLQHMNGGATSLAVR